MSEYELKDRRPIKTIFRKMGFGLVDVLVAKDVHPNTVSAFSVVFAAAGGTLLYFAQQASWLLVIARAASALLCVVSKPTSCT